MLTPFPGMDPYLERATISPNVHSSVIVALRDALAPQLRPRYYVAVEERTVHLGPDDLTFALRPDVAVIQSRPAQVDPVVAPAYETGGTVIVELPMLDEVREVYLEITDIGTNQVVTVVELLSPTNKQVGLGRRQYEQKRLELLGTLTHLVEIDLLRSGQPMPMRSYMGNSDYRIVISRAERRPQAELLPFNLQQPIPSFPLPLVGDDEEPIVDLNQLLHALYDRAGYDLRIDYRVDSDPPLTGGNALWADTLLRAASLR